MTRGGGIHGEGTGGRTEGVLPGGSAEGYAHRRPFPERPRHDPGSAANAAQESTEPAGPGGDTRVAPDAETVKPGGDPESIEPGQVLFNVYRVVRLIGRGGMGEVWLVERLDLECTRALKLIVPSIASDPHVRARFLLEAKAGARLNHVNAVTVHHMNLTANAAFIEMEYVEGQSMNRLLSPGVPMPLDWTVRIMLQLCDVLQTAHDHKIVHRDLKPSNLMLLNGRPPGREHLKVLDFGIAKILGPEGANPDDGLTKPGSFLGTVLYTSPEQATQGPVDARTDLYTVGVILYELLTGYRPFTGQCALHDHVFVPPQPLNEINPAARVPPQVEAVVLRCLAKRPEDRPQSARALALEFLEAVEGVSLSLDKGQALGPIAVGATRAGGVEGLEQRLQTTLPGEGTNHSASTLKDLPRRRQSTYEILQRIGEGDFSTVFRARDRTKGRLVAIKELNDDARDDAVHPSRYWEELRSLARLEHDHLVRVHEVDQGRGWIVMELLAGSLDARLDRGPMEPARVRGVLRQALEALRSLHRLGKVHGALKPANLLIDDRGRVKLDASGIAPGGKARAATATPKYQVPERLDPGFGPIGPGADLYGLGFTALELLMGPEFERLFPEVVAGTNDPSRAWLRWHGSPSDHLPPTRDLVPGIPEDMARVIDRLVKKNVAQRYGDAASALEDLADRPILAVDPPPEAEGPPGNAERPPGNHEVPVDQEDGPLRPAPGRRSKFFLIVVPICIVVLLGLLIVALPKSHDSETPVKDTSGTIGPKESGVVASTEKEKEPVEIATTKEPEKVVVVPKVATEPPPPPPPPEVKPPSELTLQPGDVKLVLIPSGVFLMGSPEGEGDSHEHPQHEVTISRPFYMGQTEVTQAQYERVMGVNPSEFSKSGQAAKRVAGVKTDDHPVEHVSYDAAQEYCRQLARKMSLPEGSVRLPTEAEWEYAARANSGAAPASSEALSSLAWFQKNAGNRTHPVALRQPNAFQLYDMAGNVSEWCSDWCTETYPYTAQRDPNVTEKPEGTTKRVLRGGSYLDSEPACRPTDRSGAEPDEPLNSVGFRIVLDAEAAKRLPAPPP
jgi:serine/threonine-protein kinase